MPTPNPSILDDLNPAQREAVMHREGPMLVVAGAGSGKTRVVTRRVAMLVASGVRPWQILALTFTNKAAREMRERVAALTGQAPPWMGTFHSICARFLRRDISSLGEERDARFSIYDDDEQLGLLRALLKQSAISDARFKPRPLQSRISQAKNAGVAPERYPITDWVDEATQRLYFQYETNMRRRNAVDFDDLLGLTVRLLSTVPEAREAYQQRFPFILVDEYQDTNPVQYQLIRLLAGARMNVHATGDPDQSIYSWRGADYRNIMDFQRDFPGTRLVRLEQNYRSTPAVLQVANHLISQNTDRIKKNLYTERPDGPPVTLVRLASDRLEGDWVAGAIKGMAASGRAWGDFAVVYRTNAQSRALEEGLIRAGLAARYTIVGGIRYYERREVKDLLAHLKILCNPHDFSSLERMASCRPTGVGEKTLAKLAEQAQSQGQAVFHYLISDRGMASGGAKLKSFAGFCRKLSAIDLSRADVAAGQALEISGLAEYWLAQADKDETGEGRVDNLESLVARAADFVALKGQSDYAGGDGGGDGEADPSAIGLAAFLEDVALVADVDAWDGQADRVTLMSLHSAKGLEFPVVFITGLEHGLLPHRNAATPFQQEEERRLFYVGLTRARDLAFITQAATRFMHGMGDYTMASPFLEELPAKKIKSFDFADDWSTPIRKWGKAWEHGLARP